jgi:predicted metalloprotease with PDZ domain
MRISNKILSEKLINILLKQLHMKSSVKLLTIKLVTTALLICSLASQDTFGQKEDISFEVSMENPNSHYFHISMNYSGASSPFVNFKLPSWTPGYYIILDYAKNVIRFEASNNEGKPLSWKKTTKNTWQVATSGSKTVRLEYDVYSYRVSVGEPFLDDGRAFLAPAGLFMYVEGKTGLPANVRINPYKEFHVISTGLDPVENQPYTFHANDFDILYDTPLLVGNQEILTFEVGGIKHTMAIENPGTFDREKIISDHRRMVESSIDVIGEIPYKHYTFLIMNRGMGGLEHLNSMAVYTNTSSFGLGDGYKRWLSFVAHEFFHLYNVKRIRPIALGPFDYDKENYTNMLWMSEGFTVYYEYLILNRAGLMDRNESLKELGSVIRNYENIPGHLFQSAAESSFDTWIQFFNRSENAANTTISYYDKGCALGMLIDLAIRHETNNRRSLDDVMKTLYNEFYKAKSRGFTDEEFRSVCEQTAGGSLSEIFDIYVQTTREIDYNKYLNFAGLEIDLNKNIQPGVNTGATIREEGENLIISRVEYDSPAYKAGLSAQDIVKEINGKKASVNSWNELIGQGKPGEKVTFSVSHRDKTNTVEVFPGEKIVRSFEIRPAKSVTPGQIALLDKWLK